MSKKNPLVATSASERPGAIPADSSAAAPLAATGMDDASSPADGAPTAAASAKALLADHGGKLAIGVAATLGLMIFYNWREKTLSKKDPEAYAQLQKIREGIAAEDNQAESTSNEGTPIQPLVAGKPRNPRLHK